MKLAFNSLGVLLLLVGLVWFFQGVGLLKGSVMTDQSEWIYIGLALILMGSGLLVYLNRRRG